MSIYSKSIYNIINSTRNEITVPDKPRLKVYSPNQCARPKGVRNKERKAHLITPNKVMHHSSDEEKVYRLLNTNIATPPFNKAKSTRHNHSQSSVALSTNSEHRYQLDSTSSSTGYYTQKYRHGALFNDESSNDSSSRLKLSKEYKDKQYRDKQYKDKQYRDKQYRDKQYRDKQYKDKKYKDKQYRDKQYRDKQHRDKQHRDKQYRDLKQHRDMQFKDTYIRYNKAIDSIITKSPYKHKYVDDSEDVYIKSMRINSNPSDNLPYLGLDKHINDLSIKGRTVKDRLTKPTKQVMFNTPKFNSSTLSNRLNLNKTQSTEPLRPTKDINGNTQKYNPKYLFKTHNVIPSKIVQEKLCKGSYSKYVEYINDTHIVDEFNAQQRKVQLFQFNPSNNSYFNFDKPPTVPGDETLDGSDRLVDGEKLVGSERLVGSDRLVDGEKLVGSDRLVGSERLVGSDRLVDGERLEDSALPDNTLLDNKSFLFIDNVEKVNDANDELPQDMNQLTDGP